jgi:hypothetical protein
VSSSERWSRWSPLPSWFFGGGVSPRGNVQGTIGAAQRHQSQQLDEKDVALTQQELQQFIQSDLFRNAIKNPDFIKAMKDTSFVNAIKDPGMPASDLYDKASRNPYFAKAMKDPNFVKAMKDPHFFKAMSDVNFGGIVLY